MVKYTRNIQEVLVELKERAAVRNEEVPFDHVQLRTKFKKAIAECKKTALTIKNSTGIKRFIEEKGYGPWFNSLFAIVKTRDACRPKLAIEPSSFECTQSTSSLTDSEPANAETSSSSSSAESKERIVVLRRRKRKTDESLHEAIGLIKSAIENDPVKEVLSYMSEQAQKSREQAQKSREHELNILQMLLQGLPAQQPQLNLQVGPTTTACNSHDVVRNESRQYGNHMPSSANLGDLNYPHFWY